MAWIEGNGARHCYELAGEGPDLVWVHGAFADRRMWAPQWQHFAAGYRQLRYDLRGHGQTGASRLERYSIATFGDDLYALLEALQIAEPVIIGQSFGGIIAQDFAIRYPHRLRGLVLAGSMAAIDLTLVDKLLCRVLFPAWAMQLAIRTLSVERFVRFSLWLGRVTKGRDFLSTDPASQAYLEQCMRNMEPQEYRKLWQALYDFHLLPLQQIRVPVLVLNGELEGSSMLPHTRELLRRVPQVTAQRIPGARHAANLDNPAAFNRAVQAFVLSLE